MFNTGKTPADSYGLVSIFLKARIIHRGFRFYICNISSDEWQFFVCLFSLWSEGPTTWTTASSRNCGEWKPKVREVVKGAVKMWGKYWNRGFPAPPSQWKFVGRVGWQYASYKKWKMFDLWIVSSDWLRSPLRKKIFKNPLLRIC